MTAEQILEQALLLELPELIKLGETIAAAVTSRSSQATVAAEMNAADVAADALEDTKFPPTT